MTPALAWVVGRGGMLGSRVEHRLRRAGKSVWAPATPIPWGAGPESRDRLAASAGQFRHEAKHGPWSVYWCAGVGVTTSAAAALDQEREALDVLLESLAHNTGQPGAVCIVSSAGGVYAGSSTPPFDERSATQPLSPYGETKLAMERAATEWAERTGHRVLIARLANLYGPGQDVSKPQGLVTQLVRAHLLRQPLQVYVPLDTTRDYIYVEDAADKIIAATSRLGELAAGSVVAKVVASQQAMTIGAVLGELGRVLHRRLPIVLGSSPVSRFQATDLRLRTVVWTDLDHRGVTPFPAGVHATVLDVTARLRSARL